MNDCKTVTPRTRLVAVAFALGIGLGGLAQAGDAKRGATISQEKACASCHGEGLNKPIAPNYPKIAGQHEDYVYHALRQYQSRFEKNPNVGRKNAIMAGIVTGLSDNDLKDLAAYVASLPGDLYTKH